MYIVRPQYKYGMYKVTQSLSLIITAMYSDVKPTYLTCHTILTAVPTWLQLPSSSRRVHCRYSTSDHHVQCRAAMLQLCRATQS